MLDRAEGKVTFGDRSVNVTDKSFDFHFGEKVIREAGEIPLPKLRHQRLISLVVKFGPYPVLI